MVAEGKRHDDLFSGLRVRLRRVIGEAVRSNTPGIGGEWPTFHDPADVIHREAAPGLAARAHMTGVRVAAMEQMRCVPFWL
jgi:hypothetical protein